MTGCSTSRCWGASMAALVELRDAHKAYVLGRTRVPALQGLDFSLQPGELCALMGSSGSGKTTLLNVIGCLDVLDQGVYQLDGQAVVARDFDDLAEVRARQLGFVFQ